MITTTVLGEAADTANHTTVALRLHSEQRALKYKTALSIDPLTTLNLAPSEILQQQFVALVHLVEVEVQAVEANNSH